MAAEQWLIQVDHAPHPYFSSQQTFYFGPYTSTSEAEGHLRRNGWTGTIRRQESEWELNTEDGKLVAIIIPFRLYSRETLFRSKQ